MLPIDVMDHFHNLFGVNPRRFCKLSRIELEEIVDALDGQIDVATDSYNREILTEVQRYAVLLLDNRGDDEPTGTGRPLVQLTGQDGNIFNIIGIVRRALAKADRERGTRTAPEFIARAFAAGSYDAVLRLTMEYCDVR